MPPPLPLLAELPEMVELETVRAPLFAIPPPPLVVLLVVLPEMLELETVSVPALLKAPPLPEV